MPIIQFSSNDDIDTKLGLTIPYKNTVNYDENGIESVRFFVDKNSYNKSKGDNRVIYLIGRGHTSSTGHPSSHQLHKNQMMFWESYAKRKPIHIIHETPTEKAYLGIYKISNIRRKITSVGFAYYEIEYTRLPLKLTPSTEVITVP